MPDRTSAADGSDEQRAADGGYFAPLVPAKYLRLTTFKRDGLPVSATVHGMVDADRAYFCARSRSGTAKRLRHSDAVLVMPGGGLGFFTYGQPLDTVARPLSGEETSKVAAKLDHHYPAWRRFRLRLLRRQAVYYELLAADGAKRGPDGQTEERPSSLIVSVHRSQLPDDRQVTTISMSPSATRPADA
jgi:PPOX class probable F420-dependent enzyme